MTRKYSVLKDDLNVKGGGLYCFLPFRNLDKFHKSVFKIGMALKFSNRSEAYHTYYPLGVYYVAFLEEPRIPIKTRSKKAIPTRKQYEEIEDFIMEYLKTEKHGYHITSTTRVQKKNELGEGQTEWIYTDENSIHDAFKEANKKFGGILHTYFLEGINKELEKEEENEPNYVGKIVFPTSKESSRKHRDDEIENALPPVPKQHAVKKVNVTKQKEPASNPYARSAFEFY